MDRKLSRKEIYALRGQLKAPKRHIEFVNRYAKRIASEELQEQKRIAKWYRTNILDD